MGPDSDKHKIIKEHYNKIASTFGDSSSSTMEDHIIREREVLLISKFLQMIQHELKSENCTVLDVGCGNGITLNVLKKQFDRYEFYGIDLTKDLIEIAKARKLENTNFYVEDVKEMFFEDHHFDFVYSERCLINILDWNDQQRALNQIARVLKPNGYYLMIEAFSDGLENNNKARKELGLDEIDVAYHNLYFNKNNFLNFIKTSKTFSIVDPYEFPMNKDGKLFQSNFLSSHYFFARVLHPLITRGDSNKRNTEFVKFFSHLPPYGNYSPIQAYILRKD